LVEKKLIEELREVDEKLSTWMKQKDAEKLNLQKKLKRNGKKGSKGQIKKEIV